MQLEVITEKQIQQRAYWVKRIGNEKIKDFSDSVAKIEDELRQEVKTSGTSSLIGHLRLCGALPESYRVNSSEEKLYSKYTDAVISLAYSQMGFTSIVLTERGNSDDVEAVYGDISFVADAKVFRLSRTAKNQKDFKIQAMDTWKYGKPYAMVVCPIYQLFSKNSQIYQQSSARSVWIGTYAHLAVLVRYSEHKSTKSIELLHEIFETVNAMNPSEDATIYWQTINRQMLNFDPIIRELWTEEKLATIEAIYLSKQEALTYLASERQRILSLSKEDAIKEVLKSSGVESKIHTVQSITENDILNIG